MTLFNISNRCGTISCLTLFSQYSWNSIFELILNVVSLIYSMSYLYQSSTRYFLSESRRLPLSAKTFRKSKKKKEQKKKKRKDSNYTHRELKILPEVNSWKGSQMFSTRILCVFNWVLACTLLVFYTRLFIGNRHVMSIGNSHT